MLLIGCEGDAQKRRSQAARLCADQSDPQGALVCRGHSDRRINAELESRWSVWSTWDFGTKRFQRLTHVSSSRVPSVLEAKLREQEESRRRSAAAPFDPSVKFFLFLFQRRQIDFVLKIKLKKASKYVMEGKRIIKICYTSWYEMKQKKKKKRKGTGYQDRWSVLLWREGALTHHAEAEGSWALRLYPFHAILGEKNKTKQKNLRVISYNMLVFQKKFQKVVKKKNN